MLRAFSRSRNKGNIMNKIFKLSKKIMDEDYNKKIIRSGRPVAKVIGFLFFLS